MAGREITHVGDIVEVELGILLFDVVALPIAFGGHIGDIDRGHDFRTPIDGQPGGVVVHNGYVSAQGTECASHGHATGCARYVSVVYIFISIRQPLRESEAGRKGQRRCDCQYFFHLLNLFNFTMYYLPRPLPRLLPPTLPPLERPPLKLLPRLIEPLERELL